MQYSERARQFLAAHGMQPDRVPLAGLVTDFVGEMERGLSGEKCSLDMIPTYLGSGVVAPGRRAAVIDAGGTNFRASQVLFTEDGAKIERVERAPMPGSERPATWDEFIDFSARKLLEVSDRAEGVGFCFSYRAEITPERDGRVIQMSKGVDLSGYEGHLLCADLKAALRRLGAAEVPVVLVNDTTAVALSGAGELGKGYDSLIGLVVGTGLNTCCELDTGAIGKLGLPAGQSMFVNLESGCFNLCPPGDFDRELDAATNNPNDHLFEEMVSGAYLGELCRLTLRAAASEGLFTAAGNRRFLSLGALSSAEADKLAMGEVPEEYGRHDSKLVRELCRAIFERAARYVCANLSAILVYTDKGRDEAHPSCVCADGSVVRHSLAFSTELARYMDSFTRAILGRHCVIHTADEATTLGSAAAALLNG